jgi:hypothetical protein
MQNSMVLDSPVYDWRSVLLLSLQTTDAVPAAARGDQRPPKHFSRWQRK